ncbi:Rha family transcriptional regulator [Cupriavidus sp. CV2]|uniref:Rha family transcriptional regulator n=1 Tax=Cupriavidus ulmosensis TaxID=3065913 RepID=UPI00296B2980|nr:Rha family transcriptional regulator [Cupriavidus sp. CV2]MDW3681617.1 Rha family transcriptional regulator [Cupriavidus sp. CV2]
MSSREIAELTRKNHADVLRDIRTMLSELHGEEVASSFAGYYVAENGKKNPEFNLPKRETLILVSGYSIALRARIIDRWQELEARAAAPLSVAVAPPMPPSYSRRQHLGMLCQQSISRRHNLHLEG